MVSRTLVALAGAGALSACGSGEPGNAREETSHVEVTARAQAAGGEIRATSLAYAWILPGADRPSASTRTTRGPFLAVGAERTMAHDIVENIATGLRLWPEGDVPDGSLDQEGEVRWVMEFPLGEGVRVSAFVPVAYSRGADGRWSGEGRLTRDQRWIRANPPSPDTVLIRLSGSFLDERGLDGGGQLSFIAGGTLAIASLGVYDLEIARRTTVDRVHEDAVLGRIEGIENEMLRLRGDPGR